MNWFELIVEKGKEEESVHFLKKCWNWHAIYPQMRKHFRIQGQDLLVVKALSNGCILLETQHSLEELTSLISQQSEFNLISIQPVELEQVCLLRELCGENWILEMSKGIIQDDQKKVLEGPLQGKEALIIKINRHKMLCELNIRMNHRTILAGLEITEKR